MEAYHGDGIWCDYKLVGSICAHVITLPWVLIVAILTNDYMYMNIVTLKFEIFPQSKDD